MRNLKTIENRVLAVLKEHPEARNDDMKLYLLVSKACIYDTHGISHFSFEDVMSNYKAYGIPCFESIFMCELYDYVENTEFPPEMVSSLMKTKNVLELSWDEWMMNIDSELQAINSTLTESEWQMKSAINQKEQFNQMFYSVNLLGNGAAILLIVIGLINFVNVMLTGVVARKNEFAIMESIGTTKKQIMKILTLEGGIYALISTLLIMTFGNAFLLLVADAVPHIANYAVFEYPVALVIGLIAAIFVICLSVPAIVYKATSDETVIERLHNFDN